MNIIQTTDEKGNSLRLKAHLDPRTSDGYNDPELARLVIEVIPITRIQVYKIDGITHFVYTQTDSEWAIQGQGEFRTDAIAKQEQLTHYMDEYYKFYSLLKIYARREGKVL